MRIVGRISRTIGLPEEFGRWFDLEELHDDRDGLRVLLRSKNGRLLWLSFGNALACRTCEEGDYPALSAMFGKAESGLVVLEGASWADEFVEFGSGLVARDRFTHWAIGASNYLVEVLAFEDPHIDLVASSKSGNSPESPPTSKSLPTLEIIGDSQLEIHGDEEGLRELIKCLTRVLETGENECLLTASWGGTGLGEEKLRQGTKLVNKVAIRPLTARTGTLPRQSGDSGVP